MPPHYSQSSHENATPSSGTSPLASYEEVPLGQETFFEAQGKLMKITSWHSDWC